MNQNIDQSFEWIGSEVRQMQRTSSHPNLNSKEGGLRVWEGDGQHSLLQPTKSVVVERVQPVSRAPTQSATVEQAHGESQESMQPNRCWGSPTCSSRHHTTSAASSKFTGCCRGEAVNSFPHTAAYPSSRCRTANNTSRIHSHSASRHRKTGYSAAAKLASHRTLMATQITGLQFVRILRTQELLMIRRRSYRGRKLSLKSRNRNAASGSRRASTGSSSEDASRKSVWTPSLGTSRTKSSKRLVRLDMAEVSC